MQITVIGSGCLRCRRALTEAEKAVALAGIAADVSATRDLQALVAFRTAATPALIVDGVLRSAGRVPSAREIASWLRPAVGTVTAPSPIAPTNAAPGGARRALLAIATACAAGLVLSIGLGVLHFRANSGAGASFCAIDAELDCDAVALSIYSVLLGAPIAAWGAYAYLALGLLAASGVHRARPHAHWPVGLVAVASAAGVAASAWLAWISHSRIGAFCLVCAACWATNCVIAGLAWHAARTHGGIRSCLFTDLAALQRRPALAVALLTLLAIVAAALGHLYPAYWEVR